MDNKAPDAFRTISEVADELDLPQHVLRFWESRFREIKPMKRGGGRRYYRPDDVDLLRGIRHLLYGEGYTIRGVQRILREQGINFVEDVWREGAPQPPHGAVDEQDEEEAADLPVAEKPGLIGRLIGRDLSDREDDAPDRSEPPMQSAPALRVNPNDRAVPISEEVELPPVPSFEPAPAPAAAAARLANPRLGREDLRKLHATLHELGECRKLLEGSLQNA
ncbi:MAG: MerR family transcriptional regulator [Pseudolabrys sp.]|nr:MerR family transcriptional regulator [Pseudolabrys sp.]